MAVHQVGGRRRTRGRVPSSPLEQLTQRLRQIHVRERSHRPHGSVEVKNDLRERLVCSTIICRMIQMTWVVAMAVQQEMAHVDAFARKIDSDLEFYGSKLGGEPSYVLWIDLMGAGSLMRTSMQKTANALARLHMSASYAASKSGFVGSFLPINDGFFAFSPKKADVIRLLGYPVYC
jgi:hypothetical protein